MPLTLIFFCLFREQTGGLLGETDTKRFLDSDEYLCCSVLQRQLKILVPRKKEEVFGTSEGTREDGFTGVQMNKYQKEI